jgi:hypothetical protein
VIVRTIRRDSIRKARRVGNDPAFSARRRFERARQLAESARTVGEPPGQRDKSVSLPKPDIERDFLLKPTRKISS